MVRGLCGSADYVPRRSVLNFDDYNELVISVPLQLTLPAIETSPAEVVAIDPNDPADHERPLFDFAGATCTAFVV